MNKPMEFVTDRRKTRDEVLEVIREMPGLTTNEIHALMPHISRAAVNSMITFLTARGDIVRTEGKVEVGPKGVSRRNPTYAISSDPMPKAVKHKVKEPSTAALHVTIKELHDKIVDLEAWKQAAISRYPDLAVPPVVLRARKIVAAEVRAGGDHTLADQIMAGTKDSTLMVRVTIKALEEGED